MIRNVPSGQFVNVLDAVFGFRKDERALTFLVDLPDIRVRDSAAWMDRRRIAIEWYLMLQDHWKELPFSALSFGVYPNVGTNNGDLPARVLLVEKAMPDGTVSDSDELPLDEVLKGSSVVLAPTELSATAPLKVLAKRLGFRGATMPGFSRAMIPALGLDYQKVNARVVEFQQRMNRATGANVVLSSEGRDFSLFLDLRHRTAHASGGVIREPGSVANLPSGEAYIVPYEGEKDGDPSRTEGLLPVQFGEEVVVFRVAGNRAFAVESTGPESNRQRQLLTSDPAYGNIAELGVGVLGEWGVTAVGSTLLDEKLGVHIAFGRSEHFGGFTAPSNFTSPERVIHIDWVYVPSVQPKVAVEKLEFIYPDNVAEGVMTKGRFVV
ncbi:MAG: hypothetical protein IT282_07005 [Bacteroidetes bacterium]|nr:hypothetical protein [Bacteroidota bacterium]